MMRNAALTLATAVSGILAFGSTAHAVPIYALSTDNQLFTVDSSAPGTILGGTYITGLQTNEQVVSIDIRPSTGQLYAVGSTSRTYTIDPNTGAATSVGAPFTPALSGVNFDMDFNPTVDLFRSVSDADQNLRISPVTGQVTSVDGTLTYTGALTGVNPNVAGIAYANSVAGATSTTLYAIDSGTDTLDTVNANAGTLTLQGPLGFNVTAVLGFDILTTGGNGGVNTAYVAAQTALNPSSQLYTINLTTGLATPLGEIGGGFVVRDITVAVPEPTTLSVAGLAAAGLLGRRRRA